MTLGNQQLNYSIYYEHNKKLLKDKIKLCWTEKWLIFALHITTCSRKENF